MSVVYTYIASKSTVDPYLPVAAVSLNRLARDVSDGFAALSGGRVTVGQLAQFPMQRSVPNHLLCDGRSVAKADFPELFDFLGDSEGVPADPLLFNLPDYISAPLTPATTAEVETEDAATVSTPEAPTAPDRIVDLTASGQSVTTVHLLFTGLYDATSYEYRIGGGAAVALALDRIVTGLAASTAYVFEVRGINGIGAGVWSNTATGTTLAIADPAPPPPPPDPEPPEPPTKSGYPIYGDVESGGRYRRIEP